MNELDGRILEKIQSSFPIDERPFRVVAEQLGTEEEVVISRIRALQESGIVRRIGPVFDYRFLGYVSTLCAAEVDEGEVEQVTEFVNSFEEVTHNYIREHEFNMWFTLVAASRVRIKEIVDLIAGREGVARIVSLPSEQTFKIKVHFLVT